LLREELSAHQIEELDLNTAKVVSNLKLVHFAESNAERASELGLSALPELIECVLNDFAAADTQEEVVP
jgi:hypothetical protein